MSTNPNIFLILKCCAFISVFATLPSHGGAFKVFLSHYKIAKLLFCIIAILRRCFEIRGVGRVAA